MKKFFATIGEFFREVQGEMKKVTYPSKNETVGSTTVVIIFVLILGFFLASVDFILMKLIKLIIH
ncbi:MAG TPA: preprotein translocase subunit SecE [Nitrospiria bacterium]|nr:preprotein translocase subunit SecE [Nitrospiria bacterium]